jgi:hypothetical protein
MVGPGPKSYEDLRTVARTEYLLSQKVCQALGLLEDDGEWMTCFEEAITITGGKLLACYSSWY